MEKWFLTGFSSIFFLRVASISCCLAEVFTKVEVGYFDQQKARESLLIAACRKVPDCLGTNPTLKRSLLKDSGTIGHHKLDTMVCC